MTSTRNDLSQLHRARVLQRFAYAEPRETKDVDFVVDADATSYNAVVEALAARGFVLASAVGAEGDPVPDLVLYRDARGRRVDILFAKTAFERSALARRPALKPSPDR